MYPSSIISDKTWNIWWQKIWFEITFITIFMHQPGDNALILEMYCSHITATRGCLDYLLGYPISKHILFNNAANIFDQILKRPVTSNGAHHLSSDKLCLSLFWSQNLPINLLPHPNILCKEMTIQLTTISTTVKTPDSLHENGVI